MKSKYLFFSVCLALGSILAGTHLLYSMGTEHADRLSELRYKSEHGDAEAQYKLGVLYASGKGIAQDYSQAVKWQRRAAEQGFVQAQCSLGSMYANGQGVEQNFAEAVKWWRLAAAQSSEESSHNLFPGQDREIWRLTELKGIIKSQYHLGLMYLSGEGVKQDNAAAVKWWRLAADQGNAEAQYSLGVMYGTGNGVKQDDSESDKLLQLSAKQGYAPAKELMNKMK
jgi:uncharacterized protein